MRCPWWLALLQRRWLWCIPVVLALAWLAVWTTRSREGEREHASSPPAERVAAPPLAGVRYDRPQALRLPGWSAVRLEQRSSLRDSQPDGAFHLDAVGRLRPDRSLRSRFDYYLALLGEAPLADIRRLLQLDVREQGLGFGAAAEVVRLFAAYLRLQQAAATLSGHPGTLAEKLQDLRSLRREILGEAVAQAFYGRDQLREDQQLLQLGIALDPKLSETEKRERLQALQMQAWQLDPSLRQQAAPVRLEQMTTLLNHFAADPAERHVQRAKVWGDAAADRLAVLDFEREHWRQRVEAYRQQMRVLVQDSGLTPAQQQRALQELGGQFSPQEQQRLRTWLAAEKADPMRFMVSRPPY